MKAPDQREHILKCAAEGALTAALEELKTSPCNADNALAHAITATQFLSDLDGIQTLRKRLRASLEASLLRAKS